MKSMDRKYIEEQDIAQRYLQGRLTPEEMTEFEVYLMEHPEMVEQLEIDRTFQQVLKKDDQVLVGAAQNKLSALWKLPLLAASFSLVVGVFGTLFLVEKETVYSGTEVIYVSSLRSEPDAPDAVFTKQKGINQVVLVLQSGLAGDEYFDVRITHRQSSSSVVVDKLSQTASGDLVVALPVSLLPAGILDVRLASSLKKEDTTDLSVLVIE